MTKSLKSLDDALAEKIRHTAKTTRQWDLENKKAIGVGTVWTEGI